MDYRVLLSLKDHHSSPHTKGAWLFNFPNPDHARQQRRRLHLSSERYSSFPHPFDLLPRNYAYASALCSWLILSVFCGQSLSESSTWFILNRRNHLAVEASSHSRLQGSQKGVDHKQYSKVLQAYPSQTVLKQAYPRFSLLLKLKLLSFFTNIQSLVLQVRFWGTEGPTGFMNS